MVGVIACQRGESNLISGNEVVDGRDELLLHMGFAPGLMKEVASINIVLPDQGHDQTAALVLLL